MNRLASRLTAARKAKLVVGTMHGLGRHHRQHPLPSPTGELGAGLGGGQAQGQEIVPGWQQDALHPTGDVVLARGGKGVSWGLAAVRE